MVKNCRVALIGLDGSGKSANIDEMASDEEFVDYDFIWVRWKPKLLKPVYWLLGRKIKKFKNSMRNEKIQEEVQSSLGEQEKLSAEYKQKSQIKEKIFRSSIIRGTWIFFAVVDYFLQFYFKTFRLLIRRRKIIFDRFYLDLFVDQGINFGYTPEKIEKEIKKFQWLFPKVDKIIYLRVSPETCYRRKNDIPDIDYLLKRYHIYERLSKNQKWVSVDGELPFEIVNKTIKKEIIQMPDKQ